ncbi:hypothetical protein ACP4OV_028683 [Aristida adscensionis]
MAMADKKTRAAMVSLAMVGLLLLSHLAAIASAKNNVQVDSEKMKKGEEASEGRVVYADMKLASDDSPSAAPVPAPAPAPSPVTSSSDNEGEEN